MSISVKNRLLDTENYNFDYYHAKLWVSEEWLNAESSDLVLPSKIMI